MDQTTLQARLDAGYAQVALRQGQQVTAYRPDPTQPTVAALDPRHIYSALLAFFNADPNFALVKPVQAGTPQIYVAIDRTLLQQGDYLVDVNSNTWFIGSLAPVMATAAMRCNRVFTLQRPVPATGAFAYGGNAPADLSTLLTSWPGFISSKTRGVSPEERVPGDTKLYLTQIYLPVTQGFYVVPNDILIDDSPDPARYTVALATETGWGWEIDCYYAGA